MNTLYISSCKPVVRHTISGFSQEMFDRSLHALGGNPNIRTDGWMTDEWVFR